MDRSVLHSHHMCCPGADGTCVICCDSAAPLTPPSVTWQITQESIDQSEAEALREEIKKLKKRIKKPERAT